jgi:hypothetical protein
MVGTGLGDRSGRAFSGSFRELRGRGDDDTRNGVDAEKNGAGSGFPVTRRPSRNMVRRGSTVRVRQRAWLNRAVHAEVKSQGVV